MKILLAPEKTGQLSVEGRTYDIVNGQVEVEDHHAADLIASHGFTEPDGDGADPEDLTPKIDQRAAMLGLIEKMNRDELLLAVKNAGIAFEGGRNTLQLRKMLRDHTAGMFDGHEAADAAARGQEEADLKAAAEKLAADEAQAKDDEEKHLANEKAAAELAEEKAAADAKIPDAAPAPNSEGGEQSAEKPKVD